MDESREDFVSRQVKLELDKAIVNEEEEETTEEEKEDEEEKLFSMLYIRMSRTPMEGSPIPECSWFT